MRRTRILCSVVFTLLGLDAIEGWYLYDGYDQTTMYDELGQTSCTSVRVPTMPVCTLIVSVLSAMESLRCHCLARSNTCLCDMRFARLCVAFAKCMCEQADGWTGVHYQRISLLTCMNLTSEKSAASEACRPSRPSRPIPTSAACEALCKQQVKKAHWR
jgi:hypothetical protein